MPAFLQRILDFFRRLFGGGSFAPITSVPMGANQWVIGPIINGVNYSKNMPLHPTQEGSGWGFDFPAQDGVHYVTVPVSGKLQGSALEATFSLSGEGQVVPTPQSGDGPARIRLLIQRRGDDWNSEHYRWWSQGLILSVPGEGYKLSVPLSASSWTNVMGRSDPAQFQSALNDVGSVGVTFGASFAGHGCFSNGPVHFTLSSLELRV